MLVYLKLNYIYAGIIYRVAINKFEFINCYNIF